MISQIVGIGEIAGSAQSTAIKWTKDAVVVDGNTAQNSLKSVSSDGHVLVFNHRISAS
jgi:membrane-bound inhibitor of C-type lysozyme